MEFESSFNLLAIIAIGAVGGYLIIRSSQRKPEDVVQDLRELYTDSHDKKDRAKTACLSRTKESFYSSLGLFDSAAQQEFELGRKLIPLAFAISALFIRLTFFRGSVAGTIITALFGVSIGYLFTQYRVRTLQQKFKSDLEFFLPIVMERLVMAVQSGLDILSALKAVILLEIPEQIKNASPIKSALDEFKGLPRSVDPVTRLFAQVVQLTEAGFGFENSLSDVSGAVECTALRHAFIHLGVAHREGGELVMPLRELSDSTQLYFQESVEEEIARMPVKATMPLLVTFTGLIICFITSPLLQVLKIAEKAVPQ